MQRFAHDPSEDSCLGQILAMMPPGQIQVVETDVTRHDTTLELEEQDLLEVPFPPAVPQDTTLRLQEEDLLEVHAAASRAEAELPWQPVQPEEQQIDLELLADERRNGREERRRWTKGLLLFAGVPTVVVAALVCFAAVAASTGPTRERSISTHGTLKLVDGENAGETSIHVTGPARTLEPRPAPRRPRRAAAKPGVDRKQVDRSRRQARQRAGRRHKQSQRHLRLASRAAKTRRWRRVQHHAEVALRLAPRDRQARALKRLAEGKLSMHRRRLGLARRAARRRQWRRARINAALALRACPREQRARRIKRLAERKLRHHRRHLTLAKRAARRKQWSRARTRAVLALRIAPRDRRARAIKRLAERHLKRSRRYL